MKSGRDLKRASRQLLGRGVKKLAQRNRYQRYQNLIMWCLRIVAALTFLYYLIRAATGGVK